MSLVLVTGGSGFVGAHCIVQLLRVGHEVRTTLRDLARAGEVRAMIRRGGAEPADRLTFCQADLGADPGWPEAVAGCDYVLHVASPFPSAAPEDEDELIRPARGGTLRILRAARDAGVKRVIMTSSFAAIGYGQGSRQEPFTEADWTNTFGPDVEPYIKSKTLAERAAWDFIGAEGSGLELAVVNPVGIFGPVLGSDLPSSVRIIKTMLDGGMPAAPRISFGLVDVRDVVDLHLRAMMHPDAAGQRFIAVAGEPMRLVDVGRLLRARCGKVARRAPRREVPDWLVRVLARVVPALRAAVPQLGIVRRATSEKARRVIGWSPRPIDETLTATVEALASLWLVGER